MRKVMHAKEFSFIKSQIFFSITPTLLKIIKVTVSLYACIERLAKDIDEKIK